MRGNEYRPTCLHMALMAALVTAIRGLCHTEKRGWDKPAHDEVLHVERDTG
jgi:hypothetical protein